MCTHQSIEHMVSNHNKLIAYNTHDYTGHNASDASRVYRRHAGVWLRPNITSAPNDDCRTLLG